MIEYFSGDTNNDKWVIDIYEGKNSGCFVEAGALSGADGSCTCTLEKYFGWTGILVEPGKSFAGLKKNREKSICENVCLSDRNGKVLFVDSNVAGYSGVKEYLIAEEKKKLKKHRKDI